MERGRLRRSDVTPASGEWTAGDGCPPSTKQGYIPMPHNNNNNNRWRWMSKKKLESEDDCLHRVWKCVLEKYPKFYWIIFQGASLNILDYYCFLRSPSWYYVRFWFFMKELTQVWVCPLPSYHNLSHIQYIYHTYRFSSKGWISRGIPPSFSLSIVGHLTKWSPLT